MKRTYTETFEYNYFAPGTKVQAFYAGLVPGQIYTVVKMYPPEPGRAARVDLEGGLWSVPTNELEEV